MGSWLLAGIAEIALIIVQLGVVAFVALQAYYTRRAVQEAKRRVERSNC